MLFIYNVGVNAVKKEDKEIQGKNYEKALKTEPKALILQNCTTFILEHSILSIKGLMATLHQME